MCSAESNPTQIMNSGRPSTLIFIITAALYCSRLFCIATDQSTLLDFKSQITTVNGFSDIISNNWTATTPVCSWIGVSCSGSRVSGLNLTNMGLTGAIPPYLGNLTSLTSIDISNNNFYGPISDSIYNMSSLQLINITGNAISDSLPEGICDNLPRLRILSLASNQLFGQIPSKLNQCRQLQYLSLSDNQFNGSIPEEIGELTLLRELYLGDNQLGGTIPSKIGNLTRLETLSIPDCSLTGPITSFIFNMSSLKVIDLTNNSLSGNLPMDICRSNPSVPESLRLSYNQLTGNISSNIWECRGLHSLAMSDNDFTGSIPTKVGNLTYLKYLDLAGNSLTGNFILTLDFSLKAGILPHIAREASYLRQAYIHSRKSYSWTSKELSLERILNNLNVVKQTTKKRT